MSASATRASETSAINAAVDAAADAFTREWRERTFSDAALLEEIAAGLEREREPILAAAARETSLTDVRLEGELARTTGQLRAFARVSADGEHLDAIIDTARPDATPRAPDQRRMALAIGPVGMFEAGNFPLAFGVPGGDTASALAAGCPVIAKVHPGHPRTSALVADVITRACAEVDAPAEWFATVEGGIEAGEALAAAPALEAIAFTGSYGGGRALFRAGALRERPIPVFSEMGSINPLFVTPAAARARGAEVATELTTSIGSSLGQLCTKPGLLVLVDDADGRGLADALRDGLAGVAAATMLDASIQRRFGDELGHACGDPRVATLLAASSDGGVENGGGGQSAALLSLRADELTADDPRLGEIFGPAAIVAWVADEAALVAFARRWSLGTLTATVYAQDGEASAAPLVNALSRHAGRVVLNGPPTGVTVGRATVHGGPWPATSMPDSTSVGMTAVRRFTRPVAFQAAADDLLPLALRDANPLGIVRLVDGELTRAAVARA